MKFYSPLLCAMVLLSISAVAAQGIPLSSVKVLVVKGAASAVIGGVDDTTLDEGAILTEGDSIVTGNDGVVNLIFSNGAGLTIESSTSLIFSKLEQKPYWRSDPSEYPEEEISSSTTMLELKYGNIRGNVDGLREDSEFRVKTGMGEALVSGKAFFTELYFDSFRNEFVFNVQNIDGSIDLITKFSGPVKFERNGMATKSYDPKASDIQVVRIPPGQTFSVRRSKFSPEYRNLVLEFPKDATSRLILNVGAIEPYPVDQEVMVVSPNGSGSM